MSRKILRFDLGNKWFGFRLRSMKQFLLDVKTAATQRLQWLEFLPKKAATTLESCKPTGGDTWYIYFANFSLSVNLV